jgi:hypothetical protein
VKKKKSFYHLLLVATLDEEVVGMVSIQVSNPAAFLPLSLFTFRQNKLERLSLKGIFSAQLSSLASSQAILFKTFLCP